MNTDCQQDAYSRRIQVLHRLSAALILMMIPLGFCMQGIESPTLKLFAFRLHVLLGISVLVLTLLRLIWRWVDGSPGPLPHLSRLHLRGVGTTHALLYLILVGLSISGVVLLMQSGLAAVLLGLSSDPIPANLSEYFPRQAHAIEARVYIALLAAHVGGVLLHQLTRGEVLSRMGIHVGQTAERRAPRNAFGTVATPTTRPE
jgi:cytochrome b561